MDVAPLARFVATHKQDYQLVFALRVVHAIAGAEIHFQLENSTGRYTVLARISFPPTADARLDTRAPLQIGQAVQPVFELG